MRKFSLIFMVIISLAGCSRTDKIDSKGINNTLRIDNSEAMAIYLQSQDPPALKSTEVWKNRYGPGLKLTTAHYEIFTTLLEPVVLRGISGFIESAYRAYNSQLTEPIEIKSKFTIYLFADRRQWEDFTKSFAGNQAEIFCKIKAGAYYHKGACVLYDIGLERTLSALGHEGWHQFNGRCFKFRLPSWLDEGVAMLFETHGNDGRLFYFEPIENTYRLDGLKRTLTKNKMIPLEELIAMNPGDVLATDQTKAVTAFYSQSYALVRFLQEAGYGRWRGVYRRLLLDGLTGDWALDEVNKKIATDRNRPKTVHWNRIVGRGVFEDYVSNDFEQIEKEYLTFCRQIINTRY
ncbi:MAG: hypothetical protein GY774_26915 [Planctomycetes bacterium]|nr:hypothetical protein [Planctomycetota bacterium]